MARISQSFIESLQSLPLSEVAERCGAKLKGRGPSYQIQCITPDHEDANPSFTFNEHNGGFKCHGCGVEGGGAIQFFAAHAGLDVHTNFVDAVKGLADLMSLQVEYNFSEADTQRKHIKDVLYEVTKLMVQPPFFQTTSC